MSHFAFSTFDRKLSRLFSVITPCPLKFSYSFYFLLMCSAHIALIGLRSTGEKMIVIYRFEGLEMKLNF